MHVAHMSMQRPNRGTWCLALLFSALVPETGSLTERGVGMGASPRSVVGKPLSLGYIPSPLFNFNLSF